MTLLQLLRHPAVKNICVGRCVNHDEWQDTDADTGRDRELAHAHFGPGKGSGWICVRNPNDVLRRGSKHVSANVMHELAHLISQSGHTDKWRHAMAELGQPIPTRYRKRGIQEVPTRVR
jgi:hypothetical protein